MDERHFTFYDAERRLPNQVVLLELLEKNGYETKGKYILTSENIGIPITSMLLLCKESLDVIVKEQNSLLENERNKVVATLTLDQFYEETSFSPLSAGLSDSKSLSWSKEKVWDIDPAPTISGSVVAYQSYIYKPDPPIGKLTEIFKAPNQNWVVYNPVIHAKQPHLNEINLIQIYKNIILFSEFTYAVQQRVSSEGSSLKNHCNKTFTPVKRGRHFDSVCGKRGGIIHGGSFKLKIDSMTSKLIFENEKDDVATKFTKSFSEMIEWVDGTYDEMASCLAR